MNVCHAGMIGHDGTFLEKTLKQSGVDIKYLEKIGICANKECNHTE